MIIISIHVCDKKSGGNEQKYGFGHFLSVSDFFFHFWSAMCACDLYLCQETEKQVSGKCIQRRSIIKYTVLRMQLSFVFVCSAWISRSLQLLLLLFPQLKLFNFDSVAIRRDLPHWTQTNQTKPTNKRASEGASEQKLSHQNFYWIVSSK